MEKEDGASKRKTERREVNSGEQEVIQEIQDEVRDPAPSATASAVINPVPREHAQFDWATETDTSIGPVPCVTDFRPTIPPQPVRTPPARTDCKPAAYTPTTPALVNPEPAPSHSVQASFIPVDPAPVDAPGVPTTSIHVSTSPAVRTNPIASTMPAARAPRDLSGLRSGAQNPWSNLSRRCSYIHPPRDLSSLHSSTLNPWSSLRHHNHRLYPLHTHRYSDLEPLRHSHSNTLHPEPARLPTNPESHFPVQSPIEPVQLFQIIQHPRGISLNKPKISKTVSPTPAKFQKNSCTARCACGNIIPTYSPDRRSWRPMDISRRRFEGGFDSRFRRRFSRRFSRRFCDW